MTTKSNARELFLLRQMRRIRDFENSVLRLYQEDLVHGSTHLYIGEEAIAVGALTQLREEDYVLSTHRGHGHCIAKGADMKKMLSELLGRQDGYSHGKGGSMHIADFSLNILGANGIVGASLPLALGPAMASSIRKDDRVTVCFFGDGAANQGTFHESINLAALWKLPVVFVCENNQYAVGTRFENSSASSTIAVRARAYEIPGERVDGTDVLAVQAAVGRAVERARGGEGPSIVECFAYRWLGHYAGDPATYRSKEEVEEWKKKDPISLYEEYLMRSGLADQEDLDQVKVSVQEEMEEVVAFAKASPLPDPTSLTTNVFFQN